MKIIWPTLAGLLTGILILKYGLHHPSDNLSESKASYHVAAAKATPSVVNIYSEKIVTRGTNPYVEQFLNNHSIPQSSIRRRVEQSLGSGVIMSAMGHILTNHHVIQEATAVRILLHDGRETNATILGSDRRSDLAVLKIEISHLHPAQVADSNQVNVGDIVLAIGNPLGIGQSVTQGIVSGIGRYFFKPNAFEDFIQTDAIIHQGSSGGALVNSHGLLIGINALTYAPPGINSIGNIGSGFGLVTPINMAIFVMQELIKHGEVQRGWLGVTTEPASTPFNTKKQADSLLVQQVTPGGPADIAGLKPGDFIVAIEDELVNDGRSTMLKVSMLKPGRTVEISFLRNNNLLNVNATLGEIN